MDQLMNENLLRTKIAQLPDKELIVIKLTAEWCGPCKNIKELCTIFEKSKPSSIQYYEIDIDESIDLYMKLKKMKMISGIPALLAYTNENKEHWYIPEMSHLGSDKTGLMNFFNACLKYVL
jgi:thiol-disulfide isomerase/thioredoxin